MTLLNRIEQTNKLWTMMLPHFPTPELAWIGRWCIHSEAIVEHAIIRASKKFSPEKTSVPLEPELVWRYVSGIINNEARRTATFHNRAPESSTATSGERMTIQEIKDELDGLAATSGNGDYSTQAGERYLETLERFLQHFPGEFFEWLDALLGRRDPTRQKAEALLRSGAVTERTTFGELSSIIATMEAA